MKDNIIDFCAVREQYQDKRIAELGRLSEAVEAMDMDAAQHCCDIMKSVHKANLKIQP